MQPILEVKIILKTMVRKIIEYFKQCTSILKKQEIKFLCGSQKDEKTDEKTISTAKSTDKSATKTIYDNARIKVGFSGDLLRQNQVIYNHGPVVNIYIVYETTPDTKTSNITLENYLVQLN